MKTKITNLRLIAASGLMIAGSSLPLSLAYAEDEAEVVSAHSFSATVTGTNDYVFRGITQTQEEFAIQGSMDYSHSSGVYVGAWASNIDFSSPGASSELDIYGGFSNSI
ncbi:MAG TPA: hypothetical protein EYQ81_13755, partial [Sneathiellales bacterium]|nr:hypothetical protein [Sneathiellales bacterium]